MEALCGSPLPPHRPPPSPTNSDWARGSTGNKIAAKQDLHFGKDPSFGVASVAEEGTMLRRVGSAGAGAACALTKGWDG